MVAPARLVRVAKLEQAEGGGTRLEAIGRAIDRQDVLVIVRTIVSPPHAAQV